MALTYQKDVAAAEPLLQQSLTIAHESSLHSPAPLALNLADLAEVFAQQRKWTRAESPATIIKFLASFERFGSRNTNHRQDRQKQERNT